MMFLADFEFVMNSYAVLHVTHIDEWIDHLFLICVYELSAILYGRLRVRSFMDDYECDPLGRLQYHALYGRLIVRSPRILMVTDPTRRS